LLPGEDEGYDGASGGATGNKPFAAA